MRRLGTRTVSGALLALVLLTGAPTSAEETPAGEAAPAEAPAVDPAVAAFDALEAEFAAARKAYSVALREHRAAGAEAQGPTPQRPEPAFAKRYAAAAAEYVGTDGAVPFLLQAAALGQRYDREGGKAALSEIVARHAEHPGLARITFTLVYGAHYWTEPFVRDVMTKIADATPHADVKSAMLYARGVLVSRRGPKEESERMSALVDLRAAVTAAPESRYGGLAEGVIYELENLQVGMTAPDIAGADLDGVDFKLSDYRGKVVVLDFWGDW